jgi:hypothetical protein
MDPWFLPGVNFLTMIYWILDGWTGLIPEQFFFAF